MENVGIFLFNDIELLDFAGPYEVFSVTSELNDHKLFRVFSLTGDGREIKSVNGLKVVPDYGFANHPPIDILVIPGGVGTRAEVTKRSVLDWVAGVHQGAKITMTVCSGARLPAALGLLDGLETVTHHTVFDSLKKLAPGTIINADKRFVDNGKIMTSGGISAGIDLSLHIVRKLCGEDIANKTIKYMEYGDWRNL
jgi:transcriptional regulator GlxA family with amidase domain